MISFLASPKPWTVRSISIQKNAVRCWQSLHSDIEIILYGNSSGTVEACQELDIRHAPDIEATEGGIPYFGAIARHAAEYARHDVQIYLNCDILLTPRILRAIERVDFKNYLIIGQRIDLAEGVEVDATGPGVIDRLKRLAIDNLISLHPPAGSDYFVFRRGMWRDLPPVIIGRGGYDTALIACCLQRRIPVIDATLAIIALHQFHDYSHISGGSSHIFSGDEALHNAMLFQQYDQLVSVEDATWTLKRNGYLQRNFARGDLFRAFDMRVRYQYNLRLLSRFIRILRKASAHIKNPCLKTPNLHDLLD